MTDERCKQIMEQLGMPESRSLMQAIYQVANEVEQEVRKKLTSNSTMDAIRKAYIEGYSMGHHHTVESCYCPEQAADDWLSEQHQ